MLSKTIELILFKNSNFFRSKNVLTENWNKIFLITNLIKFHVTFFFQSLKNKKNFIRYIVMSK